MGLSLYKVATGNLTLRRSGNFYTGVIPVKASKVLTLYADDYTSGGGRGMMRIDSAYPYSARIRYANCLTDEYAYIGYEGNNMSMSTEVTVTPGASGVTVSVGEDWYYPDIQNASSVMNVHYTMQYIAASDVGARPVIGGAAKNTKAMYGVVGGVARQIKEAYVVQGGAPKLFYAKSDHPNIAKTATGSFKMSYNGSEYAGYIPVKANGIITLRLIGDGDFTDLQTYSYGNCGRYLTYGVSESDNVVNFLSSNDYSYIYLSHSSFVTVPYGTYGVTIEKDRIKITHSNPHNSGYSWYSEWNEQYWITYH